MRRKTWIWIVFSLLLAVILFAVIWQWELNPSAENLTEKEALEIVQSSYQGEVKDIELNGNQYLIEMKKEQSLYQLILDAASGEILSLSKADGKSDDSNAEVPQLLTKGEVEKLILTESNGHLISIEKQDHAGKFIYVATVKEEEQEVIFKVDADTGDIFSRTPISENPQPKIITEEKAAQLAVKEVSGSVDDVELETNGNQTFYLVEVETEDDREAIVQIHAITGNILSIAWED